MLSSFCFGQQKKVYLTFEKQIETTYITNDYLPLITNQEAKEGAHSIGLSKQAQFGPTIIFESEASQWVKVSVWKKGKGGLLVVSNNDGYYSAGSHVVENEGEWQKLEHYCLLPKEAGTVKVYCYNDHSTTIYFDDFSIEWVEAYPYQDYPELKMSFF